MPEFSTRINLPIETLDVVTKELNTQLANSISAQQMIKFAHWNVKGTGFFPTHKLFDKIFEEVVEITDTIAERITSLGGMAAGLPFQVAANNKLSDYTANQDDDVHDHIEAMVDLVSEFGNSLRDLAGREEVKKDLVTQNMLLGMVETLDKYLYFLEANLRP